MAGRKIDEEACKEQYAADRAVCRTLPRNQRWSCYDQAAKRYAACLNPNPEAPMPPFPWSMPQ